MINRMPCFLTWGGRHWQTGMVVLVVGVLSVIGRAENGTRPAAVAAPAALVLDMVQDNPGEAPVKTAFRDPKRLKEWGYTGQVVEALVEGLPTFDALAPDLVPAGSKERVWADGRTRQLAEEIRAAHAVGLQCYAWMQVLVLPKAVVAKYRAEICDERGRIDFAKARTQELFRIQLREIFQKLPELDGLVVRTGEVYLQDLPYHAATGATGGGGGQTLGSTAILHGPESHIAILGILREEVCVRLNKVAIYRTWDFGNNFHVNPTYYRQVTDALEPHPNLMFSIKHQAGDFHQLTVFNPTLALGRHRQIVEVQCQREGYGKGAHPYYIGQGVIDGWEEYAWLMKPGQPRGLRDILTNPLLAGTWTWSRGGGWDGPYITNEFWCELNAYVIAKYAEDPRRSEPEIFEEFARKIGLAGEDIGRFRELCLLSTKAVLRGQLTTLGAAIDVWWARDDTLSAPDLRDFVRKGLVEKAIAEKQEAVAMWQHIEALAREIRFPDPATREFVITSCTYGRIKYELIANAWTVLLLGQGAPAEPGSAARIAQAIAAYDRLWAEWRTLKATHAECPTLPKDLARGNRPGLGAAIDKYRVAAGNR